MSAGEGGGLPGGPRSGCLLKDGVFMQQSRKGDRNNEGISVGCWGC